jgi:hypothetical protein
MNAHIDTSHLGAALLIGQSSIPQETAETAKKAKPLCPSY